MPILNIDRASLRWSVCALAASIVLTTGAALAQDDDRGSAPDSEAALPEPPPAAPPAAQGPELAVPAWGIGTQVAMMLPTPTFGAGAFAVTYDAGLLHVDALAGVYWADDIQSSVRGNLRVFFPVHRGPIADFSLGGGVGFGYLETENVLDVVWELLGGAKIRSFVGRNIALEAILGVNVLFIGDFTSVGAGGRLMGTAGFMYFFR